MPISTKSAKTISSSFKMAGLSFPPENPRLIEFALEKNAQSDKHAQAIVDRWIERSTEWPKPADIVRSAAEIENPDNQAVKARAECQRCDGTGWIVIEGPYGTSAAYPCSHKARSEAESRLGVRFTPAVARHYLREQEALPGRVAAFNAFANKNPKWFRRATAPEDVLDAIGGAL
jgi:hypothetical protein